MVFHTHKLGLASAGLAYALIIYSDYTLVYHVIEYGVQRSTGKTFQALLAHFLAGMAILSHLRAMFSDPGYVPLPQTKIDFSSDLEKSKDSKPKKRKLPAIDEWSVCRVCETYRPPRTHHCRKCGRCVRRMDHHCPWTNNCVGELNFKYFYLLLVYVGLFCCYGLVLVVSDWRWHSYRDTTDRVNTLILFFIVVIFGMFVSAIGFGQTFAVLCDRNALEVHRYGAPMKFPKTSFLVLSAALCGRGPKFLWLLPCVSPRIPQPVPPSKYSKLSNDSNSIYNV